VNELEYTEKEKNIINQINEASKGSDAETAIYEEEIGVLGFKMSQLNSFSFYLLIIVFIVIFVVVLGGLYSLLNKEKPVKKKKNK
jgi:uncharacterized ion transporter superfamily protein YfcC